MTSKQTTTLPAIPTVPMPSADLITYRFDQQDKKLEGLDHKLDKLTNMFVNKDELRMMREEANKLHTDHELRLKKLEEAATAEAASHNKWEGVLDAVKLVCTILVGLGAVSGGLWWIVSLLR